MKEKAFFGTKATQSTYNCIAMKYELNIQRNYLSLLRDRTRQVAD